jgi:hypothetical protein
MAPTGTIPAPTRSALAPKPVTDSVRIAVCPEQGASLALARQFPIEGKFVDLRAFTPILGRKCESDSGPLATFTRPAISGRGNSFFHS